MSTTAEIVNVLKPEPPIVNVSAEESTFCGEEGVYVNVSGGYPTLAEREAARNRKRASRARQDSRSADLLDLWAACTHAHRRRAETPSYPDIYGDRYLEMIVWRDRVSGLRQISAICPGPGWRFEASVPAPRVQKRLPADHPVRLIYAAVDALVRAELTGKQIERILRFYPRGGTYEQEGPLPKQGETERDRRARDVDNDGGHRLLMRLMADPDRRDALGSVPRRAVMGL